MVKHLKNLYFVECGSYNCKYFLLEFGGFGHKIIQNVAQMLNFFMRN